MDTIFIGKKQILSKWIEQFPDLDHLIHVFIDVDSDSLYQKLNSLYELNLPNMIVIAVEDEDIKYWAERIGIERTISIKEYVKNSIIKSILMPAKIRLEASTVCQLNCVSCYMRIENNGTMKSGFLSFVNFKRLIDGSPFIKEIELSNSGEIFLNPELPMIIKYAYLKGVTLTAYNGTNFNTVSDETLESMVKYCFKGFAVSIDGGSQAVYSKYRQKGDFDIVISNIKKLIALKKKYNSPYPEIRWQYIIMQHNEEDVVNAKRIAQELDIPIDFKLSWDKEYKPINRELLRKETGLQVFTREEYREYYSKVYLGYLQCRQMFLSPQINWDGRLLGCCGLYKEDYGVNVFEIGLRKALQCKRFIYAKELLMNEGNSDYIDSSCPCNHCNKRSQMLLAQEIFDPFSRIII